MGNTILIAEDFPPALRMLSKLFTEAGFTVYTATSCVEVVKTASQVLPDCFVLEYQLEDGPIPIVCAFIRGHEQLKDAPIAIHSGRGEAAESCYASCQADVFVEKGRPPGELLAAVERHLRRVARNDDGGSHPDLTPDSSIMQVLKNGRPLVSLSPEQFRLVPSARIDTYLKA
jgi:DNA-binding response OmpR family regulator